MADPDETTLAGIIPRVGPERFFWASDFPHPDHPPDYLTHLQSLLDELEEPARSGLLHANVRRAYGFQR